MRILVSSKSVVKLQAIRNFYKDAEIIGISSDLLKLPPQPVGKSTSYCCYTRLEQIRTQYPNYDLYISIENGIELDENYDFCVAMILKSDLLGSARSFFCPFDSKYIQMLKNQATWMESGSIQGYSITIGGLMVQEDPSIDGKNWMGNRIEQIQDALQKATNDLDYWTQRAQTIKTKYVVSKNFPEPGVDFEDLFSIMATSEEINILLNLIISRYQFMEIDTIVGPESRGLSLGMLVCVALSNLQKRSIKFVPIRKRGKLPPPIHQVQFKKEYGPLETLEMSTTAISPDSRILLIDDLIATGGSLKGCIDLINLARGKIADICVLRQVESLRPVAQDQLKTSYTVLIH